jgi:D-alanine--D-alanine ligase
MRVVVLAGGISTEREVSIVSGTLVCKALREKGHQAILLDVFFGNENLDMNNIFTDEYNVDDNVLYIESFNDKMDAIMSERLDFFGPNVIEVCQSADIVFLALHGEQGENGKVQAAFDLHGIKYTGSGYLSSALAMDKGLTKKLFLANGIPTPKGVLLEKANYTTSPADYQMDLPVVVKPCCGGSSVGVNIVDDLETYAKAVEYAFTYEKEVVVEEYIKGREFSVGVIAGEVYPVIEIAPVEEFYNYKNKYTAGGAVETCPANLTKEQSDEMQSYALKGVDALYIDGYARLDFMMNDAGEMFCLEANTLPGMTPTSLLPQEAQAVGLDYPELCEKLIEVSLAKYDNPCNS